MPIFEDASDGQAVNCMAGTVIGLRSDGDGFLAVRSGPGAQHRRIGQLHNADCVTIFGGQGDWLEVKVPDGRIDQADACRRTGPARQLSGPGLGWVHGQWVAGIIP